MNKNRRITKFLKNFAIIVAFALFVSWASADFSSSTSFQIERGVIDSGGGSASSSGFLIEQSVGQAGTGISTSTSFVLRGGFLYFQEPTTAAATSGSSTSPSPSTPSQSSGGGGGGSGFILPPIVRHEPPSPEAIALSDFNGDGRINITDLSIILFFYGRSGPEIARYDLNKNGVVDFADISVMMYYWSG